MMIEKFAEMIKECSSIVFFGGAGVSTESGVKDYRSQDGLYNTVKEYGVPPEEILSHDFFFQNTETFYDFYRKYFIIEVEPNNAHKALAKLENMGKLIAVITQNIDGLHQRAGSKIVIELHGTAEKFTCASCGKKGDTDKVLSEIKDKDVPRCECGGIMKPKVVLYGENLEHIKEGNPYQFRTTFVKYIYEPMYKFFGNPANKEYILSEYPDFPFDFPDPYSPEKK